MIRHQQRPETDAKDSDEEGSKEMASMEEGLKREEDLLLHKEFGMSTVEEVSEYATSPARRGKARSIVDGLVSGLRSLPRAVTHSQLYDRRSFASRTSQATSHRATTTDMEHDMRFKFPPPPFSMPFILAPPYQPMSMSMSKLETETDGEMGSRVRRIGDFLDGLNRMPWISDRVSADYYPGESTRSTRAKASSSWYTMPAPATPSDISHAWKTLPEPWFPPSHLPTTAEEPDEEGENGTGKDKENVEEKLRETREELQEKNQQLNDLRQIVEHQKMHISALEGELAGLRQVAEAAEADLLRRRSSLRRQTLHARDSVRTSVRRTSIRVSRPPSNLFD